MATIPDTTWTTLREAYWHHLSGRPVNTQGNARTAVNVFERFCRENHLEPLQTTADDLVRYVSWVRDGRAPSTAKTHIIYLRRFFRFVVSRGGRPDNPVDVAMGRVDRRYRVAEAAEWRRVREGYELQLRATGYSAETIRSHMANLSLFCRWCERHGVKAIGATRPQVQHWLAGQILNHARATVRNRLMGARSFYGYLVKSRRRKSDPTAGLRTARPRPQPRPPLADEELRALLKACLSERDRAFLLTLIGTGARISEVLAMRAADVIWEEGVILLHGKGGKGRLVAPGSSVLRALRQQVNGQSGPIWFTKEGRPINRKRARMIIYAAAARAGVAGAHPHRFRVTFANSFLRAGGDLLELQMLLGHSSVQQTAHYAGFDAAARALEQQRRFALADQLEEHNAD